MADALSLNQPARTVRCGDCVHAGPHPVDPLNRGVGFCQVFGKFRATALRRYCERFEPPISAAGIKRAWVDLFLVQHGFEREAP